jgi:hypothetical protein
MLRSAVAVVAGFGFVLTAMWIGGGLLGAVFQQLGMRRTAVAAILFVSLLAAITARLAGRAEMQHVIVLAAIMAAMTLRVVLGEQPEGQPAWYAPTVGGLGVAGMLAGGWLRASAAEAIHETEEARVKGKG